MRRKETTLAVLCLLVLAVGATRAAAAVKDFASYVPKDTLVYFEIDNDPVKIKAMQQSASGRMSRDPRYTKLIEDTLAQYDILLADKGFSLKEMGVTTKDLINLQEGGIAVAFWMTIGAMPGGDGSAYPFPQGTILFDLSTPASKALWEKTNAVLDGLAKKGKLVSAEQTIEGLKAKVLTLKDTHTEEEIRPTLLQKGDVGILALTPEVMKSVIVCIANGGKDSLAKAENYKKTVGKLDDKRLTTVYFNIERFIDMMVTLTGERLPEQAHQMLFNVLKIDNIRGMAFGSWADATGEYVDSFLYCPGMQCPLLQPLTGAAENFALIEGVSKYASGFVAMSIDPGATYKMLQDTLKQAVGEEMFNNLMQQLAEQEKMLGFSIEKDLVAGLGNEALFAVPALSTDLLMPAFVMAVEVKDRAKIEKVINVTVAGINALLEQHDTSGMGIKIQFAEKKIGKHTIYYNLIGGAYCFTDKYLIVASSADRIEQFLDSMNGDNPSITDKDEYKKAQRVLGGKNDMFGYMNMEHMYRLMGLMYYLQNTILLRGHDCATVVEPAHDWGDGKEDWDWDGEDMPDKAPQEPREPDKAPQHPREPEDGGEGDPANAPKADDGSDIESGPEPEFEDDPAYEGDAEMESRDAIQKAAMRLNAIGREMMTLAAEYVKASFFALNPEKDGLRLRIYTP